MTPVTDAVPATDATPDAKADWDARIDVRGRTAADAALPDLPPPTGLRATVGRGHVTLHWDPVPGAVGYLVHRADDPDGELLPIDHGGGDVLAQPAPPYVDTAAPAGRSVRYAVASVPEVTVAGRLGEPVTVVTAGPGESTPTVQVTVDPAAETAPLPRPWVPMIGSERLSQLLCRDTSGGRVIGEELIAGLRRMRDEIGVRTVRAHAIFHADTGVYRETPAGEPLFDFSVVDRIYDTVLELGLRPVVEVGFMPDDLAADPTATVFEYGAVISPPKDWDRWGELVRRFTAHLIERYGADEVTGWDFEVWNEANLEVFWSGTKDEWFRLYDVTAAAIKGVDERIAVGGPSSAAAGWVDDLLAHCRRSGSPVDFVSTHTYGSPPLDVRASLQRHGYPDARILWTEWGVTPTHFAPVNDTVFAGIFLLDGMSSAAGRVEALSYWVASDHFEELGRPPRLLHGGFGLRSVGDLPKPKYHAVELLSRLGPDQLPVTATGDGSDGLVKTWASRHPDGRITVLLWNFSLDQTRTPGSPEAAAAAEPLARRVELVVDGPAAWTATATTLAPGTADLVAAARELGVGDWPTPDQWPALAERAALTRTPVQTRTHSSGLLVDVQLPNPAAVCLEFTPAG